MLLALLPRARIMALRVMTPTFFEGPEKKVELVVDAGQPSLRSWGDDAWATVVNAAGAQVLSVIRDDCCDAYLLSESSLFVYDRYLTMITCGRTTLVDAVLHLLERIPPAAVSLLIYERKNEHFPELQHSSFYDDARRLAACIPGAAYRFGDEHDHHVQVFCSAREFTPDSQDTTVEILMHGLPEDAASRFVGCERPSAGTIADARGITRLLPGFVVDEHPFTPAGYSMNAIREGGDYYTIHVTPEALGSYVSFESNVDFRGSLHALVSGVIGIFRPRSFDVVTFAPVGKPSEEVNVEGYRVKDSVGTTLAGYDVRFWHCYQPILEPRRPSVLSIDP
ncbi:MAG: adenosylmethionine decarboxylase [Myxococcota bacterium]